MSAKPAASTKVLKTITENRRARHEYHILETYEAGIALTGTEVKSLRAGKANLQDSYARVDNGEMMLYNMHISPYEQGNRFNHDPKRTRRLLMHKQEIMRLFGKVREKGLALVPLKVYFNPRGRVKVELALAQGKKSYDKRQDIAARDAKREMDRAIRERQKI
ncbi:SsrA-binding protein [Desulfotomaculum nigrificans CO-1-SRB]|uniref:SsrA-binding protein n=1 Tax=Desulfotomaculum nigrificans (strain DSM 14880 / VKM B-2319 / CO-1-SRB) TaxID=868595 RepID=F6B4V7_DESCC|nr:SsrA-binding protein SmpB [Desulfotomaculum nigrificans]AEF95329.1 SsrA-binding protein [Desulfotomaculum nigrificans CO-1-SRB]